MRRSRSFPREPSKAQPSVKRETRRSTTSSRRNNLSSIRCTIRRRRPNRSRIKSRGQNLLRASPYPIRSLPTEISKRQWKLPDNKKKLKRMPRSRPRRSTCGSKRSSRSKSGRKSKIKRRKTKKRRRTTRRLRPKSSKRKIRNRRRR